VCQSLFEKDKLLFAFLLTSRLLLGGSEAVQGAMHADELRFLLTGGVAMDDNPHDNPAPEWLSGKAWGELCRLDALPNFGELREFVTLAPEVFQPLFAASDPVQVKKTSQHRAERHLMMEWRATTALLGQTDAHALYVSLAELRAI
jgi:dynein heavy chain